ncbi:hypothetical protein NQ317_009045 [Molorchus minor]|uniref:Small ribosomal subunit protein mS29 n=1 Tax=Molorchus minor TaxID=1323400 RepID=A0ABQ9JBS2_9CUCU|nr:hypothetical protein NQ317_009045 [Molorchus minor]
MSLFMIAQPSFRINEIDPLKHSTDYEAKFYTLPENDKKQLFSHGGLPKSFEIQANTFNETCLMVRQSSLDIINCFKSLDYSKPAARFVLYGKKGSGKTLTLAHMLHGAYKNNFLIVHVPWVANWMYRCKESSSSETQEGYTDLNMDAAAWLLHFKTQNAHLLDKGNLITAEDHVWSKREITPKGSSLMELIDHGISRVKYASNCVVILANEIKGLSNLGVCKTLVAIDDELAIPIKDQISYLPRVNEGNFVSFAQTYGYLFSSVPHTVIGPRTNTARICVVVVSSEKVRSRGLWKHCNTTPIERGAELEPTQPPYGHLCRLSESKAFTQVTVENNYSQG